MQKHGLTFPALFSTLKLERDYGVDAYPTSFFVDQDGRIQWTVVGVLTDDRLQYVEEREQRARP